MCEHAISYLRSIPSQGTYIRPMPNVWQPFFQAEDAAKRLFAVYFKWRNIIYFTLFCRNFFANFRKFASNPGIPYSLTQPEPKSCRRHWVECDKIRKVHPSISRRNIMSAVEISFGKFNGNYRCEFIGNLN